jgi:hypothetical protein
MEEIKCKCGCGETVPPRTEKGPRQRLFVNAEHRLKFHKIKDWSILKPVPPEIARERQQKVRKERKENKVCVHCGREAAVPGRVLGPVCRYKNNERRKVVRQVESKKEVDTQQ